MYFKNSTRFALMRFVSPSIVVKLFVEKMYERYFSNRLFVIKRSVTIAAYCIRKLHKYACIGKSYKLHKIERFDIECLVVFTLNKTYSVTMICLQSELPASFLSALKISFFNGYTVTMLQFFFKFSLCVLRDTLFCHSFNEVSY